MVLEQLGGTITRAIEQMNNATIIDEKVLKECLHKINRALLNADVNVQLVCNMQMKMDRIVNIDDLAAGHNQRRIIHQAIFNDLCHMLDTGKPSFTPKRGNTSVVLFVGLQGSGKTTTCTKYAYFHQKKGWKPALVCADNFRADAFDQLKQNATEAEIPFYGSYSESNPVKIAVEGVETFKKENCDLIIVDTSGHHKQAALFEEMSQAMKPDLIVFVMDSSIGQAAYYQARAFKQSVPVGAVIVTKMDGHAKGAGALSAVAATKSPVIFMGTGEHMDEFEVFDVKPFVSRLLGMGDWSGFTGETHEVVTEDQQAKSLQMFFEGNLTLRFICENYPYILKLCPIGQGFMPKGQEEWQVKMKRYTTGQANRPTGQVKMKRYTTGQANRPTGQGREEWQVKLKRYTTMMGSMTNEELDSANPGMMNGSRMMRIARDSGCHLEDVKEMLEMHRRLAETYRRRFGGK